MRLCAGVRKYHVEQKEQTLFGTVAAHIASTYLLSGHSLYQLCKVCRCALQMEHAAVAFKRWLDTHEGRAFSISLDTLTLYRGYHAVPLQRSFLHEVLLLQHASLQSEGKDQRLPASIAVAGRYPATMYLAKTTGSCPCRPSDIDIFFSAACVFKSAISLYISAVVEPLRLTCSMKNQTSSRDRTRERHSEQQQLYREQQRDEFCQQLTQRSFSITNRSAVARQDVLLYKAHIPPDCRQLYMRLCAKSERTPDC
jgi:hypothetical protein